MRIIGIDPGYGRLGVAVIDHSNKKDILVFSNCIETKALSDQRDRLLALGTAVREILDTFKPDVLAIEKTFFGKNKKTAIAVSEARGALLYETSLTNTPVHEYSPGEVKVAVTGYGASTKRAVADMLPRLISIEKEIRYDDEFDAIAVALTHAATLR